MAALQTAVNLNPAPAFFGQEVWTVQSSAINTYAASTTGLFFGEGVVTTDGATVEGPTSGSTLAQFAGFIVRNAFNENNPAAGYQNLVGDATAIMRIGEIYAAASVSMAYGDTPYLILADSIDGTKVGQLTNSNAVGTQTTLSLATVVRIVEPVTVSSAPLPVHISVNMK